MMYLIMALGIIEIILVFVIKVIDLINEAEDDGDDLMEMIKSDIIDSMSWD